MKRIFEKRIVPVAVIDSVENAAPVAEALCAAGLDLIEVTFRNPEAEACVRRIRKAFPEMLVGAGTLLEPVQVERAIEAGAQFGVSPGLNEAVVRKARESGFPFVPGVMTPSDVEHALALGCKLLKFFPAEAAGGIKMLQSLAGPYAHTGVKFIPLGGVSAANCADYAKLPIVAAVGGSWLLDKKLIAEQKWTHITKLAREALVLMSPAEK